MVTSLVMMGSTIYRSILATISIRTLMSKHPHCRSKSRRIRNGRDGRWKQSRKLKPLLKQPPFRGVRRVWKTNRTRKINLRRSRMHRRKARVDPKRRLRKIKNPRMIRKTSRGNRRRLSKWRNWKMVSSKPHSRSKTPQRKSKRKTSRIRSKTQMPWSTRCPET